MIENRKQLIERLREVGNDESKIEVYCSSDDGDYNLDSIEFDAVTNTIILQEEG